MGPLHQSRLVVLGHSHQFGDHHQGDGGGVIGYGLHLPGFSGQIEPPVGLALHPAAIALRGAAGEGPLHHATDAGVAGRLQVDERVSDQAGPGGVLRWVHPLVDGWIHFTGRLGNVADVPAEPPVLENPLHITVESKKSEVPVFVPEDRLLPAQRGVNRDRGCV